MSSEVFTLEDRIAIVNALASLGVAVGVLTNSAGRVLQPEERDRLIQQLTDISKALDQLMGSSKEDK